LKGCKSITDFGVFVDLGGVDGLIHITDLSWGRINHPSEVVKLDETMKVVVTDYDEERKEFHSALKSFFLIHGKILMRNIKLVIKFPEELYHLQITAHLLKLKKALKV
jgi:DNA-directed RNA polymerase subunit E'/Rpb7